MFFVAQTFYMFVKVLNCGKFELIKSLCEPAFITDNNNCSREL